MNEQSAKAMKSEIQLLLKRIDSERSLRLILDYVAYHYRRRHTEEGGNAS